MVARFIVKLFLDATGLWRYAPIMTTDQKRQIRIESWKLYRLGVLRTCYGCEICGTDDSVHMHHVDYEDLLDIRWLCCHHHHLADKLRRRGMPYDPIWIATYWSRVQAGEVPENDVKKNIDIMPGVR